MGDAPLSEAKSMPPAVDIAARLDRRLENRQGKKANGTQPDFALYLSRPDRRANTIHRLGVGTYFRDAEGRATRVGGG